MPVAGSAAWAAPDHVSGENRLTRGGGSPPLSLATQINVREAGTDLRRGAPWVRLQPERVEQLAQLHAIGVRFLVLVETAFRRLAAEGRCVARGRDRKATPGQRLH
jgi:hypothetical protein